MKKPTTLRLTTTLCFLLISFFITVNIPLAFSEEEEERERVLDTNCRNLTRLAHRYYILPAIRGPPGGGVSPGETGNQICPVTALQYYSAAESGKRAKLKHTPNPDVVVVDTPLKITFENMDGYCAESTEWVVVSDDYPRRWVGIGGVEDHLGKEIVVGNFNIQKYPGFGYKLLFCPAFASYPDACFHIGRRDDENGRRLILAEEDDPIFPVVFVDVDDVCINGIRSIV